jgi:hypothetical protein
VGAARADAYRQGVEAMGNNYALLQIFTALAERQIRLTPDVLVQAGASGNGASDGLFALVLRDMLKNKTSAA